ncbi:MAG: ABC transporter ATP-binding protein/permease [Bacteroidia bacterium]|nr:ABC transporter ATP-binding protein/permease [Bacteroidia bacterium]
MKSLKYLNKYLWKYRKTLAAGILFIILTNILNILSPYLVRIAFDNSLEQVSLFHFYEGTELEAFFRNKIIKIAAAFGGLILLATIVRGVFMFLMRQTVIIASRKIEYDLKNEIYSQYQKMNLSFFRANFTGDLMNRLSEDVSKVRQYLGPAIMYFVNLVFTFITVIVMMVSVNPKLTLYVLLPLPFLSASIYYVSNIINRKSDLIQAKLSDLTTFVQESMSGVRVLKAFSVQAVFANIFSRENDHYKDLSMSLTTVNSFFSPLMMSLVGLSTILTIYLGGLEVIDGNFTYGNIAEFVIYVNLLTWPVSSLGWVTAIIQSAAASQARINKFLEVEPEIKANQGAHCRFENEIRFDKVSFQYNEQKKVLHGISFKIPKGQTIGLVGHTGSGKTTLLNLLARFYDTTTGQILIDNTNLKELNLKEYRDLVSYVPQDVFLFSESIYDNILFGSSKLTQLSKEDVERVAKIAAVHDSIREFPQGYDTPLGERGITLSGGQKQRIALARALIRDPEIILLDDCLSAVDHTTEKIILANLRNELKNRTAVIVSHRLSVIANTHIIIVLNQGRIDAIGTHEELLKSNAYYKKLYEKQMEEGEPQQ